MRAERWRITLSIQILLAVGLSLSAGAAPDGEKRDRVVPIDRWLLLGPVLHRLPLFHDEKRGGYALERLVSDSILPEEQARPAAGEPVQLFGVGALSWTPREAGRKSLLRLEPPEGAGESSPAVAWMATYLTVDRWQSHKLELRAAGSASAWLDGEAMELSAAPAGDEPVHSAQLELTTGKHLLLVRTTFDPASNDGWRPGARLTSPAKSALPDPLFSLDPERDVELRDVLDPPRIGSLGLSPDGKQLAISVKRTLPAGHESESWIEIRDVATGSRIESWRGAVDARAVAWSPDDRYISYLASASGSAEGKSSTLYLYDRSSHRVRPLLEGVENLRSYLWSPDGRLIAYSTEVEAEADERGVKLLQGLMDRWADYRDKQYLHLVSVPGGARRRLTAGALTTRAQDFSPDGGRLLFTREVEALDQRPYSRTELWEIELAELTARKLRDFHWFNGAAYSPDGRKILLSSQPSEFGELGVRVPEGVRSNGYDSQLFVWDPANDDADAITREFDPAVTDMRWSRFDGRIYLAATDGDHRRLYRYDLELREFTRLESGVEVLEEFDIAISAPVAVATGSSTWKPQSLVALDLKQSSTRRMEHPSDEWFSEVRSGGLENWSFRASSGQTIDGRVYLPPAFDPTRRYPAIVYYYGGTSSVTREFGGRYPKEWWSANGYVVYVLQPSGATGYGQQFSAIHVNDWGKTTADEIIEGTRKFLETHPYVDPQRVGCIGASYGGFMTMLLSTRTDLFSAAVAHAGISSIASYWGEGYWGYSYSSVASADSFPWNNQELYVEQSPLFRADQQRVPLLLTHGDADKNVPVGESDAFYIALKMLGKQVEYLQIGGQDHWIVDHAKRELWSSAILAWFDRWLKQQPDWWEDLFAEPAGESK